MQHAFAGTILLDVSPGEGEVFERKFLEGAGHPVLVCHGPHEGEVCPLLAGHGCSMVDDAHGIVFQLDVDRPEHRAILRRYQAVKGDAVPIRAVVKAGQAERYAELLAGVETWSHEPTAAELDAFAAEVESTEP